MPLGEAVKVVAKGLRTSQVYEPVLSADQLATLDASPDKEPFDGDPHRFRLGVEALRLSLAYEHDPYFSLSIARVDPLPHQLEAVYDYTVAGEGPIGGNNKWNWRLRIALYECRHRVGAEHLRELRSFQGVPAWIGRLCALSPTGMVKRPRGIAPGCLACR